jgi:hypothetical protein
MNLRCGGGREGRAATVLSTFNSVITGVKEGGGNAAELRRGDGGGGGLTRFKKARLAGLLHGAGGGWRPAWHDGG